MLKEINRVYQEFLAENGVAPRSVALSYMDALDLLVELSKNITNNEQHVAVSRILMKGDRNEVRTFIENSTVLGMTITVTDIVTIGGQSDKHYH